ncbi:Succinyl-CoA ligase [ADP-forming] subunit beta [Candidatus Cyrtobacter comes]|uniref:Succinate--CoA ligase [ADP-forming] subunit beta n=2 Tax=Candidatus Cyrtobacter comes TaxID=675776 RepID=A0ABU5L766_9RICK|nr:Succinyl-CoA ligase [ADP-forming] subunit beta [Candidatus Cyrtobacter comes]
MNDLLESCGKVVYDFVIVGCFVLKMDIHEYQAKEILRDYGVKTPSGFLVHSAAELMDFKDELVGKSVVVVKAQVHAGGRGKAGGIKLVTDMSKLDSVVEAMLGMRIITKQTGLDGKIVRKVYIEDGSSIEKEYYVSVLLDRETSNIVLVASTEGGMDIEEVAEHSPDKIAKVYVDPTIGLQGFHKRNLGFALGFSGQEFKDFSAIIDGIYRAFIENDANQIEINPLIKTKEGELVALDAKMSFDSNALYRNKQIVELEDKDESDPLEVRASEFDLNYIKMDGSIGCMVNGAGLAMATMDIIKMYGESPANFLDVGGGATEDKVREAFRIITSDSSVKGILVNIFGGIMKCDIIARGIVAAASTISIKVPLVVRLEGTNSEKGKLILKESGMNIVPADDLQDAALKIVRAVR